MLLICNSSKQAADHYFSRQQNGDGLLPLKFIDNIVQAVEVHKHLGLSLDKKRDFKIHIDNMSKCNKIIDIMKQLSLCILHNSLLNVPSSTSRLWRHNVRQTR